VTSHSKTFTHDELNHLLYEDVLTHHRVCVEAGSRCRTAVQFKFSHDGLLLEVIATVTVEPAKVVGA
jgi:hypothetical protein